MMHKDQMLLVSCYAGDAERQFLDAYRKDMEFLIETGIANLRKAADACGYVMLKHEGRSAIIEALDEAATYFANLADGDNDGPNDEARLYELCIRAWNNLPGEVK